MGSSWTGTIFPYANTNRQSQPDSSGVRLILEAVQVCLVFVQKEWSSWILLRFLYVILP